MIICYYDYNGDYQELACDSIIFIPTHGIYQAHIHIGDSLECCDIGEIIEIKKIPDEYK